jgi:hypothetical protein
MFANYAPRSKPLLDLGQKKPKRKGMASACDAMPAGVRIREGQVFDRRK